MRTPLCCEWENSTLCHLHKVTQKTYIPMREDSDERALSSCLLSICIWDWVSIWRPSSIPTTWYGQLEKEGSVSQLFGATQVPPKLFSVCSRAPGQKSPDQRWTQSFSQSQERRWKKNGKTSVDLYHKVDPQFPSSYTSASLQGFFSSSLRDANAAENPREVSRKHWCCWVGNPCWEPLN